MDGMGYFNPLQSWTSPTFPSRSPDWPSSGRIDWKAAQQEILSSHWVHRIQKLDFPQLHQLSWKIQQMILAISLGDLFGWSHPQQHFKSYIRLRFGCAYSKVQCLQLLFKKYAQGENGWSKVSNCPPARCRFLPKRSEADEMDVQGAILPEETQENLRRGWCEWSANCVLLFISDQSWWVTQFSTNPLIFTISLYRSLCYRLYPIYYT